MVSAQGAEVGWYVVVGLAALASWVTFRIGLLWGSDDERAQDYEGRAARVFGRSWTIRIFRSFVTYALWLWVLVAWIALSGIGSSSVIDRGMAILLLISSALLMSSFFFCYPRFLIPPRYRRSKNSR